jgi:hypothetical protein
LGQLTTSVIIVFGPLFGTKPSGAVTSVSDSTCRNIKLFALGYVDLWLAYYQLMTEFLLATENT